jgi:hypothetical protein
MNPTPRLFLSHALSVLAAAFLAACPAAALAQANALNAAGMFPGQSPQAAASAFAKAMAPWEAHFPNEAGAADALGTDCPAVPAGSRFWVCKTQPLMLGDGAPSTLWAWAEYESPSPSSPLSAKSLGRARALLAWTQPSASAWKDAVARRGRPIRQGPAAKALARKTFADSPEALAAVNKARSFVAAHWAGASPQGQPIEAAALAALDAKGAVLALAVESAWKDWPARAKAAAKPVPANGRP